jgi:thiamine biosynthesis lipoprotein
MGTDIDCLVAGDAGARIDQAEREFARLEALLSRFRAESELSRLNRLGRIVAGPELLEVTRLALDARERTNGLFDPTVHDALAAAGYDRSFELLADREGDPGNGARRCGGDVRINGRAIWLEPGFRLDLGGIAKGYAVDRAVAILASAGNCLVNAGGDVAVSGGAWPIAVENTGVTVELTSGGLATSGRNRRRWTHAGQEQHHLIDPRTGRPASTELLYATVVGATAVDAEVLAKVAFLTGHVDAPHVLVTADGRVVLGGGLS